MTGNGSCQEDLKELRALLQQALKLELSTIPPYATACYSIREQGTYDRSAPRIVNAEAIEVIRQVMVEEMLHMVLVANVLNALGGQPSLTAPEQLPVYPCTLLNDRGPTLRLRRFSPDQVKSFREVERAPDPQQDRNAGDYHTIAGFYAYVVDKLDAACRRHGEDRIFGRRDDGRQIGPGHYYGAGGKITIVRDLSTAQAALKTVIDEGEGANHGGVAADGDNVPGPEGREDIAHFFKFDEILHSRYYLPADHLDEPPTGGDLAVDWDSVWPMQDDPKHAHYRDHPEIAALSDRFNTSWSALLDGLEVACNGKPERLFSLVPLMYRLKQDAQGLMRVPLPDKPGETAGPTWEYCGPALKFDLKRRAGQ